MLLQIYIWQLLLGILFSPYSKALSCPIVPSLRMKVGSRCQMKISGLKWTHSCLKATIPPLAVSLGFSTAWHFILSTSSDVGRRSVRSYKTRTLSSGEWAWKWVQLLLLSPGRGCAYPASACQGQPTPVLETRWSGQQLFPFFGLVAFWGGLTIENPHRPVSPNAGFSASHNVDNRGWTS